MLSDPEFAFEAEKFKERVSVSFSKFELLMIYSNLASCVQFSSLSAALHHVKQKEFEDYMLFSGLKDADTSKILKMSRRSMLRIMNLILQIPDDEMKKAIQDIHIGLNLAQESIDAVENLRDVLGLSEEKNGPLDFDI